MGQQHATTAYREIEALKARASWYRNWAEVAGNDEERQARIRMADYIELKAKAASAALSRRDR